MSTERFRNIIDQAAALGYRGKVCMHRLSEPLLDSRYVEFAKYVKSRGMVVMEDTNGDVLRKNPQLIAELDGLVDCLHVGLYDYRTEQEKWEQMEFWKKKFKKTSITFSLPSEFCAIKRGSMVHAASEGTRESYCVNLPCFIPVN